MTCLAVLLLLPAVHAEEGPAEPHDQAARSPQAPCGKRQAMPRVEAGPAAMLGASPGRQCGWSRAGRLCGFPGQGLQGCSSLWPCLPLSLSVPPVPSASCPGRSCSCTRRSSTVGRSCLCARSAGTGHRAGMACRCTSRPSTGGTILPGLSFPGPALLLLTGARVPQPVSKACSLSGGEDLRDEAACQAGRLWAGIQAGRGSGPPWAESWCPVAPGMELMPSFPQAARICSHSSGRPASAWPVSLALGSGVFPAAGALRGLLLLVTPVSPPGQE